MNLKKVGKITNYYKRRQLGTELRWYYNIRNTLFDRFKKNFVVVDGWCRLAFVLVSIEVGPWATGDGLTIFLTEDQEE